MAVLDYSYYVSFLFVSCSCLSQRYVIAVNSVRKQQRADQTGQFHWMDGSLQPICLQEPCKEEEQQFQSTLIFNSMMSWAWEALDLIFSKLGTVLPTAISKNTMERFTQLISLHAAVSKQVLNCGIAFHLYQMGSYRGTSCLVIIIDFLKEFWNVVANSYHNKSNKCVNRTCIN